MDIEWEIARRELKRCLTEEKSKAHSAFKLAQIKQKPNENLRNFYSEVSRFTFSSNR